MPNISGLYTALSGMNANRRILDATAHNIANQATPGFRRQRVDLAPAGIGTGAAVFSGPASQLAGVNILGTNRVLDSIAETRAVREIASTSDALTMSSAMRQIESAFPEPTDRGLAAQFDGFWTSWSDLATRPDDTIARTEVLEQAKSLTQSIGRAAADLDEISANAQERLGRIAGEVNDLAGRIAKLNDLVVSDNYIQPILSRTRAAALGSKLTAHISGWDNDLWQLASWYRET